MLDFESLESNLQAEVEGVWRPLAKGARVKVARIGNDEYMKLLRRKFKSNRAVLEQEDDLAAEINEELLIEVYAHTILKDVEGIGVNGQLITKYTPEIGIKLLSARNFREKIKAYAEDMEAFLAKQEDAAVKS